MAFSALFQFKPGDYAGQQRWLLEHYLEHMEFYRALMEQTPPVITLNYPIQRMDEPTGWLGAHQKMSQSVWSALGGGQSTDFGDLDWSDANKVQDWMNSHQLWHKTVRDGLDL
jgi:hypothetical protein